MRQPRCKRGIVGIEAAIVLIAFIITAAALSYVVVNMGFFTAQKTKETISSGLEESLSSLQLDGVVTAKTNGDGKIEYIAFPVKLSVGKSSVDLKNDSIVVSVYLPNATLMDIYNGTASSQNYVNWDEAISDPSLSSTNNSAIFVLYNADNDSVLESTEKAFLVIHLSSNDRISDYQTIKIEVKATKGAALTIVRTAPGGMSAKNFIDLG